MKQHTIAKYLVAAALLGGSSLALSAQALTVEDYCDIKKSSPARIKNTQPSATTAAPSTVTATAPARRSAPSSASTP